MRINLKFLPWTRLKRAYYSIRSRWFSKPRPRRDHFHTEADVDTVRRELASVFPLDPEALEWASREWGLGFTNGWEFSFHKRGEDLNMRMPLYIPDEYEYYQLHVRGYEQPDGSTELDMHLELEPSEHPEGHLNGVNYQVQRGLDIFEMVILPELSINARRVER